MLFISDLMPLTPTELDYRELQRRYPFIHQSPPLPLPDLLRRLQNYPEYEQTYQRHFSRIELKTHSTEQVFQRPQAVEVVMHPRFVPGILHSHDFFELLYVLNGTVEHYTDNTPQLLKPGDICIIAPKVIHGIGTCKKDTLLMSVVLRASTFAETFFNILQEDAMLTAFFTRALYSGGTGILYFNTGYDREIQQILLTMLYEFRSNKPYNDIMLNNLMTACFILLLRSHADSVKTKDASPNSAIVPILHYLQNNSENLTLHQLAQHFSYSDRQMTRLLVQSTGQNFTQLIQRLKLEKARILLAHSNLSIQEIINRCGYTNPTYFYRLFAKNFQMTPASYRQKQLEN